MRRRAAQPADPSGGRAGGGRSHRRSRSQRCLRGGREGGGRGQGHGGRKGGSAGAATAWPGRPAAPWLLSTTHHTLCLPEEPPRVDWRCLSLGSWWRPEKRLGSAGAGRGAPNWTGGGEWIAQKRKCGCHQFRGVKAPPAKALRGHYTFDRLPPGGLHPRPAHSRAACSAICGDCKHTSGAPHASLTHHHQPAAHVYSSGASNGRQ